MKNCSKLAVVVVIVAGCFCSADIEAAIVAQTGFNATTGINPSDYTDGATLDGKGAGEPGWTGNWTTAYPADYTASSATLVEGDLSMKITSPGTSTPTAVREFTDSTGVVYVDALYRATGALSGDGLIMYTGPNSAGHGNQNQNQGAATMVNLGPGTGGQMRVSDHTTGGSYYQWVNTGRTWTPNQWVRVTQEIHTQDDWYRVWVDRNLFDPSATDPLNFRSPSTFVDDFEFFLRPCGSTALHVDQLRVLTHNPLESMPVETGFEPSGGYVDGQTVAGKGLPEDGWTGNWVELTGGGSAIAQSAVARDGQLALKLQAPSSTEQILREYVDQEGAFTLEYDIMIDGPMGANLYTYSGPQSEPSNQAATMVSFYSDQSIRVGDGNGSGIRVDRDTGLDWVAGQWLHVRQQIQIPDQLFNVWIDGVKCVNPTNPLGYSFRRTTSFIDDIKFLMSSQGSDVAIYVDNISVSIPEPATLMLLSMGLPLVLLRSWRRIGGRAASGR